MNDMVHVEEDDWVLPDWSEQEGILLLAMRRETLFASNVGHKYDVFGERTESSYGLGLCQRSPARQERFARARRRHQRGPRPVCSDPLLGLLPLHPELQEGRLPAR